MSIFLHEHENFKELLEIVASNKKINDPYLVEKDYWIMHCLWALQNLGFAYHLKGGTSLSKGYKCIHRFSEDIDIRIDPNEKCGFPVFIGKNHDKPAQCESRKKYFDWIAGQLNGKIHGLNSVSRDHTFDDADSRSGGIRLHYTTLFTPTVGLKEGILLEIGFDNVTPSTQIDVGSWALEHARSSKVEVHSNVAKNVNCYAPTHTFVEKLQAVSKKFKQYKEKKSGTASLPENFIRHYYDLYQLLDRKDVQDFIGTPEYQDYKRERFKSLDTNLSQSEAFKISDKEDRKLFEKEYERSKGLYYQGRPTLDDILQKFASNLSRL